MRKLKNEELGRKSLEEFRSGKKMPVIVVLDDVRSMHNIGSVFRTSDAFSVEKILLCGITAQPPHREISKTALGATESVSWNYYVTISDAIEALKSEGYKILCIEQVEGSIDLADFVPEQNVKYAVVLGNEVNGVSQSVVDSCDFCLEIPQFGTKHSFNISVTAGIVLYDLTQKFTK
ncbi:MAG: putative TrmH family tRNA/rRNA methyltransferase [Bacteroidia bacterium]|nr:putative TrmH family tRNA/rRNA methyltransferase [Bacteroidia bacterium]